MARCNVCLPASAVVRLNMSRPTRPRCLKANHLLIAPSSTGLRVRRALERCQLLGRECKSPSGFCRVACDVPRCCPSAELCLEQPLERRQPLGALRPRRRGQPHLQQCEQGSNVIAIENARVPGDAAARGFGGPHISQCEFSAQAIPGRAWRRSRRWRSAPPPAASAPAAPGPRHRARSGACKACHCSVSHRRHIIACLFQVCRQFHRRT